MTEDEYDDEYDSEWSYRALKLRELYQDARKNFDAPRRMDPDEPAIERLTGERKLLWAQFHKAEDDGEARAYEEFLAWFPGPIGWKPGTWAIGKRLRIILFPQRHTWSLKKRQAARLRARREFESTYSDPRSGRNFILQSNAIDAELKAARMPESRAPYRWQMDDLIKELHTKEGLGVAEIAELLSEGPDHIASVLRLRRALGSTDGSPRWESVPDYGGSSSFDGGFSGCSGGGCGGGGGPD
ncbi:hypothetical protein [Nocardia fusca]|uniref:hypothetical protein n=1 Tax=Nocardia fusca TaxID=941183 RepID=UPI0007A735F9|nr:hypothetical protein [Nocardia fusca]